MKKTHETTKTITLISSTCLSTSRKEKEKNRKVANGQEFVTIVIYKMGVVIPVE